MSGVALVPAALAAPPNVDLMDALKRSVAEAQAANVNEAPATRKDPAAKKAAAGDRRQTNMLLAMKGGAKGAAQAYASGEGRLPKLSHLDDADGMIDGLR